ncbi:flagellar basal body L-ring protein FlgH [Methylomonas sp. 2BW1-5-20]|uniref:flagellar basal body L-ring protein FlgH n=1 Tax=Methylomonas sp. 2BW1-5-20 TaxID=3376686 RepID=UPI00404D5AB7
MNRLAQHQRQTSGKFLLVAAIALLLAGCDTLPKRDPDFAPVQPADLRPPRQSNGAIYQAGYDMRLFEDIKTRRVGDILTITLAEDTKAKKQADMNTSKDTSVSVTAPTLFGVASQALLGHDLKTSLAATSKFAGIGKADQSNSLTGDISVTVVEVLPNGNMRVRGEKRVTLNDGSEYIRVSGIVRPIDIDAGNTISSAKVADATIMYTGDGGMADSNKVGWLARFFLSPIFPF